MVKKSKRRKKHVPQRTCVGCREVHPKRTLTRVVSSPDGVIVDTSGKAHGRGAYLHDRRECWMRGIKSALDHALKIRLTDQEKESLLQYMEAHIPDESKASRGAEEVSG